MPIRHNYQSATANDGTKEISSTRWNEDHAITDSVDFPVITSTPSGALDTLKIFAARRGGRSVLRMVGQNGIDVSIQPALFGNSIALWLPGTGTTVAINFGTSWTALNSGTSAAQSHPALGTTSDVLSMKRAAFGTGTTATGTSGIRTGIADFWRGNATGRGGFFFHSRFGVETFASDLRIQVGLAASTAVLAGDPSALVNCCMVGKDTGDANWQFMHNDASGAATKVNTGIAINNTDVWDFFMFAPPNGTSIAFEIRNAMTGASFTHEATTDLPVSTTFMCARASILSVSGTTAKSLSLNRMYIETDL